MAIAYSWLHPKDGAQDGLLVVEAADEPGAVAAFRSDSWHQSPTPRACEGTVDGGVTTVGYEYDAGWRWQITVDPRTRNLAAAHGQRGPGERRQRRVARRG